MTLEEEKVLVTSGKKKTNVRRETKVSLEEQKAHKEDRFPQGRHVASMIYDYTLGNENKCRTSECFTSTSSDRHSCSTVKRCAPVPCCTYPDHLTTTHSFECDMCTAQTCISASCEVSVSVSCSLSWNLCLQCVADADRSESSRGVSVEAHFILVIPCSTSDY